MRLPDKKITIVKHGSGDERRAATPGSVIKPFVLQTLLGRRLLTGRDTFLCPGNLLINGRQLSCVHPRMAAPMDVERALAYSCNCAVAHWAERIATAELASRLAGAGLPVVAPVHDVRLLALGEEGVRVSALQLAQACARLPFSPEVWAGLESAVRYGTAQRAALPKLTVAGKTGSGGVFTTGRVAWFAGFVPSRRPEFVIVVMAAGASGGSDAAPLARELWLEMLGDRA